MRISFMQRNLPACHKAQIVHVAILLMYYENGYNGALMAISYSKVNCLKSLTFPHNRTYAQK